MPASSSRRGAAARRCGAAAAARQRHARLQLTSACRAVRRVAQRAGFGRLRLVPCPSTGAAARRGARGAPRMRAHPARTVSTAAAFPPPVRTRAHTASTSAYRAVAFSSGCAVRTRAAPRCSMACVCTRVRTASTMRAPGGAHGRREVTCSCSCLLRPSCCSTQISSSHSLTSHLPWRFTVSCKPEPRSRKTFPEVGKQGKEVRLLPARDRIGGTVAVAF
jgi:hypothetical protein